VTQSKAQTTSDDFERFEKATADKEELAKLKAAEPEAFAAWLESLPEAGSET
jgi:hypothetical protein